MTTSADPHRGAGRAALIRGGVCALAAAAVAAAAWAQPTGAPAAVDPATMRGLESAAAYRPPSDIAFAVADFFSENVRLTAQWLQPADAGDRRLPVIVIAPGWGATAASLRPDAVGLARAGYRVMLFDYRGWGESDGRVALADHRPGAGGTFTAEVRELRGYINPWEQAEDWFNAVSYAAADPKVDAGHIGVMGSDLAGGHVIYLAAHDPRIKALVSVVTRADLRPSMPYTTDPARVVAAANATAGRLAGGQESYPAERARRDGGGVGAPVGNTVVRWAPVERAGEVTAPALFVLAQNEELFSNAANGQLACERVMGPRKLMILPRITHYGVYGSERDRTLRAAIAWFDRRLKPADTAAGAPGRKEPERGECFPPPEPPKGDEDPNGSGQGHKAQDASARFN